MSTFKIYKPSELPDIYKYQILAFQRIIWTEGFVGKNQNRNWITHSKDHPIHFIAVNGRKVIAHVEVVWRLLHHCNKTYKTYGLTGVLTFHDFRRQGFGRKLVEKATKYILRSDAELALFNCTDENVTFYRKGGWKPLENAPITQIGERNNPINTESTNLMIKFLSKKARRNRQDFLNFPIYFDDSTW
ncbi:MAG: GNAT family N-acetyltransferase [Patescibacteria group bacterium]|nr:GNAT family N-acetyltransferase [Patescibacteria group bacterium]